MVGGLVCSYLTASFSAYLPTCLWAYLPASLRLGAVPISTRASSLSSASLCVLCSPYDFVYDFVSYLCLSYSLFVQ